jgi:hypothetical protein
MEQPIIYISFQFCFSERERRNSQRIKKGEDILEAAPVPELLSSGSQHDW